MIEDPAPIIVFIDESDSPAEIPAIRQILGDLAAKGRDEPPMTGPGGRWRPVAELFERDADDAKDERGSGDERSGEAMVMRMTLCPAGDCAHCGLPIEESHLFEFRPCALFATDRPLTILIHTGSGHERCEGRDTVAERIEPEEGQ
jgi:hypothetical protein